MGVHYIQNPDRLYKIEQQKEQQKAETVTLTFSVGLHSRCRVDSISKQTVSGHFQTDHSGTNWP